MSTYRNYSPWSTRASSYTSSSDKTGSSPSSLDRSSRFSSNYRPISGVSSSSYRPNSISFSSVRERAAAVEAEPQKSSVLGKYSSRSYGSESIRRKASPEPAPDKTKSPGTTSYRRFGSSSYVPPETPTLRYGNSSRFGGQIARSPISEKSPTVFGVSNPNNRVAIEEDKKGAGERCKQSDTVIMVSRGTSPTPPPNSAYLRTKRAEMDKTTETTVPRSSMKPSMITVEIQTEERVTESKTKENTFSGATARSSSSAPPWTSRYSGTSSSNYTPSSSSTYASRYTPRSSGYTYTRPTDLPLKSTSMSKTSIQEKAKTPDSPTTGEDTKKNKFEGKDTSRIGGFSYTRQTDLPLTNSLNRTPTSDNEGKSMGSYSLPAKNSSTSSLPPDRRAVTSPIIVSKDNSISSSNENLNDRTIKPASTSRKSSLGETIEITLPNSTSSESANKVTRSLSRSSKLSSPDRSKLPPPVPKSDSSKCIFPNKDFRKSVLNMDLSSSNESLEQQRTLNQNSDQIKDSSETSGIDRSLRPLVSSKSMPKLKLCCSPSKAVELKKTDSSYESSSEEPTSCESSESSDGDSSDDEYVTDTKTECQKRASKSNVLGTGFSEKMGLTDETSISIDKPPIPPSSPGGKKGRPYDFRTEEAKAVVVRALAPITGTTKLKYTSSSTEEISDKANKSGKNKISDKSSDSSSENAKRSKSKSSLSKPSKDSQISRTQSGEKAWWLQSTENIPKNASNHSLSKDTDYEKEKSDAESNSHSQHILCRITPTKSGERLSCVGKTEGPPALQTLKSCKSVDNSDSELKISDQQSIYRIKRIESGERPWWLDSHEDSSSPQNVNSRKSITASDSELKVPDENNGRQIKRIESGARAWWLQSNSNIPSVQHTLSDKSVDKAKSESACYKIKKIQSGERAWWMGSSSDENAIKKTNSKKSIVKDKTKSSEYKIKSGKSGGSAALLQESEDNTSSGVEAVPTDKSSEREQGNFYHIQRIESGEQAWWLKGDDNSSEKDGETKHSPRLNASVIKRIESGERAWWMEESNDANTKPDNQSSPAVSKTSKQRPKHLPLFIGFHRNIDDLLGTEAPPPAAFRTPNNSSSEDEEDNSEKCLEIDANQVRIHDSTARTPTIRRRGMIKLDDTALQLYKDGDYGAYLDLDASINEQQEEFESFQSNRKNSIVLRTQLSVRVHTIIEKLLSSEGRELRRALFSLKQIFQEDKDLVHEFVQNDGLACLIKVGSDADQNYQNYILRALGQVMLYVDGMNGVIEHSPTVQWLYSLVASKFRLVVKTALKLLLVFVEYVESNSVLLIKAIHAVDSAQGLNPWANIMKLLKEYDAADTELLIYATSLINKTLNGLPDQDTYYDQVDALEEQGFEEIIRRYMSKQGTDLDLLRQFQIYEAVLHHEDGEEKGTPLKQLDETIKKALRHRKSLTATLNQVERRKSRRHSTGTSPNPLTINTNSHPLEPNLLTEGYHNRSALRNGVSGGQNIQNGGYPTICNGESALRKENTVKDLTQKLAITLHSPVEEGGKPCRVGDMKGIISKAKEGLAKSQSKGDVLKSPTTDIPPPIRPPEIKKSETELHWEELMRTSNRELSLCDLDFTDLANDDDHDVLAPASRANGIPPPPPQCGFPPPAPIAPFAPPPLTNTQTTRLTSPVRKNKKTVKLFWKEVRADPVVFAKLNTNSLIWDELATVTVDTQKLEHLFESRAKDLITKKQQELNKNKEIIVLDPKRSNAINIGMTKLPPPRSIKAAILKMDPTVMNREGIEKLLTMLPSEEERSKIQEAQAANPDLPLGNAEQFLLTLASISELPARLKLWAFKLDFEISEKEIAEPLMDLKQGMDTLKSNNTFRAILSTLLSIGIFLNGSEVKGFQIDYLAKVPEVKDTVHKHSLLHHLCHMVMEKFPDSTDLYSEIGAVTRASKVDFDELTGNIQKMEVECKASFDHLKIISKHDGATSNMKVKMSDFLADCAERIIVLTKVHRRVMNRYHKFCLWIGIPFHRVQANKPNELCRIVSEFALEYRTTRERVLQQLEKKANHRERNKTRGKMITEVGKFRSQEDRADAELRQLLGNDAQDNDTSRTGSLPWRRQRKENLGRTVLGPLGRSDGVNGNLTDADDEIIESLVKTATKVPTTRTAPRERKRTRHAERKSLIKRSRTRDNVPVEGNPNEQ